VPPSAPLDIEAVLDPAVDIGVALEGIRASMVPTTEALIWARLYAESLPPSARFSDLERFDPHRGSPWRTLRSILQGRDYQDALAASDINPRLRDYWAGRFGSAAVGTLPSVPYPGSPSARPSLPGWLLQSAAMRWLISLNEQYDAAERSFGQLLTRARAGAR